MKFRLVLASFVSDLRKRHWWFALLLWLMLISPAQAAVLLRIAVEEGANQIKIGSSTKAIIRDDQGRAVGELPAMDGYVAQPKPGKVALDRWQSSQISVEPTGNGYVWIGNRWYRGQVLLVPQSGGLTAVNYVDLEQYLYSVLGAEMSSNWPQEALKAQAVAARSYALYKRQRSENIYDLGDDQSWQVYKGIETEAPATYAAVDATAGQVLTYRGQIILAAFHAASGGHTENVEEIWTEPLPYLRGVDDYDQGTPGFEWTETFSRSDLSQRLSGVGNVISMTPERTTTYGSVISMKVVGDRGTKVLSGDALRSALGLRSLRFTVVPQYGPVARTGGTQQIPNTFEIKGRGFGHAIGMSQWGAYNLATQGYNYQQILLHYYQGTTLAKIEVQ